MSQPGAGKSGTHSLLEEIIDEIRLRADIILASKHGRLEVTWQDGVVVGLTPSPHFRRERPKAIK